MEVSDRLDVVRPLLVPGRRPVTEPLDQVFVGIPLRLDDQRVERISRHQLLLSGRLPSGRYLSAVDFDGAEPVELGAYDPPCRTGTGAVRPPENTRSPGF